MARPRKSEIRVHPLLDELRPRLKASARRALKKSLQRVGQLSDVLITSDDYILDGRDRYELLLEMGMEPRFYRMTMHSGQGELPPGYSLEEELELCREVIEESGRGKWRDSGTRRERARELVEGAQGLVGKSTAPKPEKRAPCEGNPIGVRFPPQLRDHLERMAARAAPAGGRALSVPEYIRELCWRDYSNSQPTHESQ